MPNQAKTAFLTELVERYGSLRKLERSNPYSRVHGGGKTFYGLREDDLQRLEGVG